MSMLRVLICGLLVATCSTTLTAGERGPDKYQGTVLFDRWDACSIYSGVSVMYVSKSVKEKLRPLNGQRVLINAKEVYQPKNPGDGLIKELEVVWPIPKNSREWVKFDGLTLKITVSSDKEGKPVVTIKLRNTSDKPIEILSDEWTPTLFTRGEAKKWTPYDDASFALVTRVSFQIGGDEPRWHGKHWTIGKENALPRRFMLEAKSDRTVAMQFDLPDGEYDFICGYGSHQGFASRPVGFDVRDGKLLENAKRSTQHPKLGTIDLGEPIAPLRAQWVWQRPIHDHTGHERPLALSLRNNTGHQVEIDYDPKRLSTFLFDKDGKKIEMGAEIRSGPVPQPQTVSIAPGCTIEMPTHRGGIPFGKKKTLLAGGWQSWQLEAGDYSVGGTVTLSVKFGKQLDSTFSWNPVLENNQTKSEWFGKKNAEPADMELHLPEVRFSLK